MTWTHLSSPQQVVAGAGALGRLADAVRGVGARRVVLITSEGRRAHHGDAVARALGRSLVEVCAVGRPGTPSTAVQQALSVVRSTSADAVVSLGGGSVADLAKAVCFFVEQEQGTPATGPLDRPTVPHVAVPTTHTPAAFTPLFGVTDEGSHRRSVGGAPTLVPAAVLLDHELFVDSPPRLRAATGLAALAVAVEASWSRTASPEAKVLAVAAAARLAGSLPAVVEDPGDEAAAGGLVAGAVLAGRALGAAGGGALHGLADLVAARAGSGYAAAVVALAPAVLAWTAELAEVAEDAAAASLALGDEPAAAVSRLRERLGLPEVSGLGLEDVGAVARMAQSSAIVRANRRPVDEADVVELLNTAFPLQV